MGLYPQYLAMIEDKMGRVVVAGKLAFGFVLILSCALISVAVLLAPFAIMVGGKNGWKERLVALSKIVLRPILAWTVGFSCMVAFVALFSLVPGSFEWGHNGWITMAFCYLAGLALGVFLIKRWGLELTMAEFIAVFKRTP